MSMCLKLLALRHLWQWTSLYHLSDEIITDLERMGDQAVNIAERAISLNQEPQLKPIFDSPHG